jgi:hypothetical protein
MKYLILVVSLVITFSVNATSTENVWNQAVKDMESITRTDVLIYTQSQNSEEMVIYNQYSYNSTNVEDISFEIPSEKFIVEVKQFNDNNELILSSSQEVDNELTNIHITFEMQYIYERGSNIYIHMVDSIYPDSAYAIMKDGSKVNIDFQNNNSEIYVFQKWNILNPPIAYVFENNYGNSWSTEVNIDNFNDSNNYSFDWVDTSIESSINMISPLVKWINDGIEGEVSNQYEIDEYILELNPGIYQLSVTKFGEIPLNDSLLFVNDEQFDDINQCENVEQSANECLIIDHKGGKLSIHVGGFSSNTGSYKLTLNDSNNNDEIEEICDEVSQL